MDQYIVDEMDPDVLLPQDIPLADLIVTKGGLAINPRGNGTEDTVKERYPFAIS